MNNRTALKFPFRFALLSFATAAIAGVASSTPAYWFSDGVNPGGSGTWFTDVEDRWSTDPVNFTPLNGDGVWVQGGHAVLGGATTTFRVPLANTGQVPQVNRLEILDVSAVSRGVQDSAGNDGALEFTGSNPLVTGSSTGAARDILLSPSLIAADGLSLGTIGGTGGFWLLQGNNTGLNGVLAINHGTRVEHSNALGVPVTGLVNDPNRAELTAQARLQGSSSLDIGATIVAKDGGNIAMLGADHTISGNIFLDASSVIINRQDAWGHDTITGNITLVGSGSDTLDIRAQRIGGRVTVDGVIADGTGGGTLSLALSARNNTQAPFGSAGDRIIELRGDNTYSGITNITNAGAGDHQAILLANNTTGSATGTGDVQIGAGLAGHGHIEGDTILFSTGNFITAGNIESSNSVTQNLDYLPTMSTIDQDLNRLTFGQNLSINGEFRAFLGALDESVGFTQLALLGDEVTLSLGAVSTITLDFLNDIGDPDSGDPFWNSARSWTLIQLAGQDSTISGTFENVNLGSFSQGEFSIDYTPDGVILSYIPEPGLIGVFFGLAAGAVVLIRRRQRQ